MIKELYNIFLSHSEISIDTRKIKEKCLFFALKGPNYNGNRFAHEAIKKGAAYAIVDDEKYVKDKRYILVENVLENLQNLAKYHRSKLNCNILAITGTNGKTTSKELCLEVVKKKFKTIATKANLNNHIGVPLSILSISAKDEFAIIEMGANHIGEIEFLCNIVMPTCGVITNIGKAHLEGFYSLEGIIQTKTELYRHLAKKGFPIFVKDNLDILIKNLPSNCPAYFYGEKDSNKYIIKLIGVDPYCTIKIGPQLINTHLIGEYNFDNLALSIAVGLHFGVELHLIKKAIEDYTPSNNRSEIIQSNSNTILLDAYNSNPMSVEKAIDNMCKIKHPHKVMILGDMSELGEESDKEHQKLIKHCIDSGIKKIFLVGKNLHKKNQRNFISFLEKKSLIKYLKEKPLNSAFILIKGSRSMELEEITHHL